jgi:hypothetical protein
MNLRRSLSAMMGIVTLLALSACSDAEGPYIEVQGGGFIFNYRIAEATMGLVAVPLKEIPAGSVIEARFQNPAGGDPLLVTDNVTPAKTKFSFTTPPLKGIEADKPYKVTVRLLDPDGKELQRIEKDFRSNLDQSVLPEKPLVVGPVYTPNPELVPKGSGG